MCAVRVEMACGSTFLTYYLLTYPLIVVRLILTYVITAAKDGASTPVYESTSGP